LRGGGPFGDNRGAVGDRFPGSSIMSAIRLRFAPFTFDREREQLLRAEHPVRLRPKTLGLLRFLIDHTGRIVEREEIMRALWPGVAVTDVVLNVCVAELRRALGDDRAHPRYVETVHRRGFRFVAALEAEPGSAAPVTPRADDTPFVGREAELRLLQHLWAQARAGEPRIVLVTGGAGIGKSSLVTRFLRDLTEHDAGAALLLARGQCLDLRGRPDPFLPVVEALGALCAGPFGDDVVARIRASAPALLLHLPLALEPAESAALHQRFAHRGPEAMLRDLARALAAVARVAPLVLVLEDLHWADSATVDLVAALAERRDGAAPLLIGTIRPGEAILEGHPRRLLHLKVRAGTQVTELPLALLGDAEVLEYLRQHFGDGAVAARLAPWLTARTDGNPLFMSAIVEHLVASGVVRRTGDAWSLGEADLPTEAPASLARLLRDRMSELAPRERQVLEVAAVCGLGIASQAVAAGVECTLEEAEALCQSLAERHLMLDDSGPLAWPDGSVAQSWRFRHALYRQVVEATIPAARLRQLHARVGASLERAFAGSIGDIAALLAGHFHAAADDARVVKYGKLAARRAASHGGYHEAIMHLSGARAALGSLPPDRRDHEELKVLTELAPLSVSIHGLNDAATSEVLARTRALSAGTQDLALQVASLSTLATTWRQRGEIDAAAAFSRELLAVAGEAAEPPLRLAAHMIAGSTFFHASEFAVARRHFERCLGIGAENALESDVMPAMSLAAARGHLAVIQWLTGFPSTARRTAEEALEYARRTPYSPVGSMAHALAAWAFVLLRDFARVEEITCSDAILASEPPLPLWTATTAVMRGWAWVHRGRTDEGLAETDRGFQAYLDSLGDASSFDYRVLRCEAYARAGRVDEAATMVEDALENLRAYRQGYFVPELYRIRGEVLATGGGDAARAVARDAWHEGLGLARTHGAWSSALRLALALAGTSATPAEAIADRGLVSEIAALIDDAEESPELVEAGRLAR